MKKLFGTLFVVMLFLLACIFLAGPGWSAVGPSTNVTGSQISTEGWRATYGASDVNLAFEGNATDVVTIFGSATKTVRIRSVTVSGLATTAGSIDVSLIKRTAVNTGGTSSSQHWAKFDSSDGNATATVLEYTADPTVGAGYTLSSKTLNFGLTGYTGTQTWDFSDKNDKAVVLRGVAQGLAINFNGQTKPAGGKFSYAIEWTEE